MSAGPAGPPGAPRSDRADDSSTAPSDTLLGRIAAVIDSPGRDPAEARLELEQIVRKADESQHVAAAARGRYALARVLVSLGEAEAALDLIDAAESCWRSIEETNEALRTNLGRMHVLDDLGRHDEAAAVGRKVADELERHGDTPDDPEITWLRAAVEENTGVALGYLGRHADALDAYASASACYDHLGARDDSARASLNRGVELCELARPIEAIDVLEVALTFFVDTADRLNEALCLTNLSEAWIAAGRYLEAFRCLDAAESALKGLDHTTDWLRAQLGRADCLVTLNLDVEALDLYDDLVGPLSEAGLKRDLGKVHLGRGAVLARAGVTAGAGAAFELARSLFASTGDRTLLARTCLAASALEPDPADSIETAIEMLSDGERPAEYALALLAAAKHYDVADPRRAADCVRLATTLIEPLGVPDLTWQLHHRTGRLLRRVGDRPGARKHLDIAAAALNDIRSTLDGDGPRQRFDGARRAAADDMIELLLDSGDVGGAVGLVDSMHSRGLVEAMREQSRSADDATVRAELRSTYDRLLTARGPLVDELTGRARRLERHAKPKLLVATAPVARFDRATHIPPRTLCYRIIQQEVIAFVGVGSTTHVHRKVCEVSRIEHLLSQLVVQWRRFEHPEVVARHFDLVYDATLEALRELHSCLVAPLAEHIPDGGPLTVVADGPIGAVPFAALHDGRGFLVDRFAIRQTPSVSVDQLLCSHVRSHRGALAMGTADQFAPLAAVEAARVGEAWEAAAGRCVVLQGDDATAAAFIAQASEYDVIHVAGHGLFRDDAPEFSAIRLADRWVTAAEISRLELAGQLVVLSACDTGSRHASGPLREVVGLPRALLAAGASGVIASLWPADDVATTQLMSVLHQGLARGRRDADALRRAQLATRESHPHPYHWASTILVGGASGTGTRDHDDSITERSHR